MDEYKIEYLKMEQSALLLIAANDDLKDENKKLKARIKELEYYKDTSVGLWCIDRDPMEVDLEWIRENAFQLEGK